MSFEDLDLYKVLQVNKTNSIEEIKKSYFKLALKYHPDRLVNTKPEDLESAKLEFQKIGFAYSILSEPAKKKHYDRTGSVQETSEINWTEYFETMFRKVTEEDIKKFEHTFKNSAEEKRDLLDLYVKYKGDLVSVVDDLLLGDLKDESRYRDIIEQEIKQGTVKRFPKFGSKEGILKAEKKKKRMEKEAIEAEAYAKELGLYSKDFAVVRKQKRQQDLDDLTDRLAEKYAPKSKSKKKAEYEITDLEFEKTRSKLEKKK